MKASLVIAILAFGTGVCSAANHEKMGKIVYSKEEKGRSMPLTSNILNTEAGEIDFGWIESIPPVPGLIQHIKEISGNEKDTFNLDNQSKWMSSKIEMVKNWKEDGFILTQNQAFFSTYPFALVNPRLKKAVPVSLVAEPLPIEDKTFFIENIDFSNDLVRLTNQTEWTVHHSDHGTFRKFSPHDRVMIGVNSSDKIDTNNQEKNTPYILINTTSNSYVRVNKYDQKR